MRRWVLCILSGMLVCSVLFIPTIAALAGVQPGTPKQGAQLLRNDKVPELSTRRIIYNPAAPKVVEVRFTRLRQEQVVAITIEEWYGAVEDRPLNTGEYTVRNSRVTIAEPVLQSLAPGVYDIRVDYKMPDGMVMKAYCSLLIKGEGLKQDVLAVNNIYIRGYDSDIITYLVGIPAEELQGVQLISAAVGELQLAPGTDYSLTPVDGDNTLQMLLLLPGGQLGLLNEANGPYSLVINLSGDRTFCMPVIFRDAVPESMDSLFSTNGWQQKGNDWYYYENSYPIRGWRKIEGDWRFFDMKSAALAKGWVQQSPTAKYYFDEEGSAVTGRQEIEGNTYYMDAGGRMKTGWQKLGGEWYYFRPESGALVAGEQRLVEGQMYFFNDDGRVGTGWQKMNGQTYYLDTNGSLLTGWQPIKGSWYYFFPTGIMATGKQDIEGRTFIFKETGEWARKSELEDN